MTAQLSPLFSWRSAIASKESGLAPTLRHVALTLSLHMSEKGDSCFPNVSTLMDESGLAESTVRDALKKLCALGWLVKEARYRADGGQTSSNYAAAVPIAAPLRETEGGPPADGGGSSERRVPTESVTESVKESDTETDAPRRAVGARQANDALFQSMVIACGMAYDEMTDRQRKSCGVAMAELRRVGATPDEVERRAMIYRQKFQAAALTPNALTSQWAALRELPPAVAPPPRESAGRTGMRKVLDALRDTDVPAANVIPLPRTGT